NPLPRLAPRIKASHPNSNDNNEEVDNIMNKIIVGFVSLMITLLPCEIAFAYGHANRYGGSSSHSWGSSSHSNAAGGSTSHTAGQGTSHPSGYGASPSPHQRRGTTHTKTHAATTSGEDEL